MIPSPLHPAVVHFPIVLMFLLPLAALGALWAIRRGASPVRAWMTPLALAAALTLSAWVSVETGEGDEDRAEAAVGEQALATHEAAAERFLILSGAVLLAMGAGLVRGRLGRGVRVAATAGSLLLIVAGYQVGHSGGRLVYGDGVTPGVGAIGAGPGGAEAPGGSPTGPARGDD